MHANKSLSMNKEGLTKANQVKDPFNVIKIKIRAELILLIWRLIY
jgi:hypothetical protein